MSKIHKYINIDNLPKRGKRINWNEAIGYDVYFEYGDVKGYVKIIGYNVSNKFIKFQYKEKTDEMYITHLKR